LWPREVYWLSAVEELDHEAIAGRLGIRVVEVEWLLAEALLGIVLHLDADGRGEE
jgi:DNA-directed RNA polymerase specialized sigma24 family protein